MNKPNNKPNRRTRRELMGKSVAKVGGWMEPAKVEGVGTVTGRLAKSRPPEMQQLPATDKATRKIIRDIARVVVTGKVANIAHYSKLNPPKRTATSTVKPNPHVDTSMTPTEPLSAGLSRTLSRPGPAVRYPYGPK